MSKFSKLPNDVFNDMAFNAGTVLTEFDPTAPAIVRSKIIGASTGGFNFNPNLDIASLFEGIDNAKTNTKKGKHIKSSDPHLTGTLYTIGNRNINMLLPNATVETTAATTTTASLTKATPNDGIIPESSYFDVWFVTDYASITDANGVTRNGFFAIHLMNCLNVTGLQPQTTDEGKMQYPFDFQAHYDPDDDDQTPPYEIYFSDGAIATNTITITTQPESVTKTVGDTASFTVSATTTTGTLSYQWQSKAASASEFSDIASATSATLSLTASEVIADNDGTQYRCVVSNGTDTINSNAATLTVSAGV